MILRTRKTGDVSILEMEGQLDFETTQQFAETCVLLLNQSPNEKLVFNMEKLRFVGSSGINQFVRVLKEFNSLDQKPRLCNLSSEFQKIIKAYQTTRNPFAIFESEQLAMESFTIALAAPKAKKKKKISN